MNLNCQQIGGLGKGMVAPACNLSYLGGRDWQNGGLRPAWTKVCKLSSQPTSLVWQHASVIPTRWKDHGLRSTPVKMWDPI
jgi:hypothetical protein